MKADELKRVLTAFADSPADVDLDKGQLLVKIRDDVLVASVRIQEGEVLISEDGFDFKAHEWIVKRLARLSSLADRIIANIQGEDCFIEPAGRLLDQLEFAPDESERFLPKVSSEVLTLLERHPAFTTSILYLTSDAGEGKTTVINHLARVQAERYKKKETSWLLIPVSLGGRPFLRLDDVVVGTLTNRYRFPFLYYDAFLELIRMGVVVPALDGFEEMFIENAAGDAISSLGMLLSELDGQGSLLVAARKAYFEYRRLQTQTKLFDALRNTSVSFARISIDRWDQSHFTEYCSMRGIENGNMLHDELSRLLGSPTHPALTRAVFVRKLVDLIEGNNSQTALFGHLRTDSRHYVTNLVDSILHREASEKWIDKSGEVAKPLISIPQHRRLLADLATEMLNVKSEQVPGDILDVVAQLFCESQKLEASIARQVVDRFKQHALIVEAPGTNGRFSFDHAEFYFYFIGEAVGRALCEDNISDVRYIARHTLLPPLSIERAVEMVHEQPGDAKIASLRSIDMLVDAAEGEGTISYSRENCGALIIALLDDCNNEKRIEIKGITFASDALLGKCLTNTSFVNCYFRRSSLSQTTFRNVAFDHCAIECLELSQDTVVDHCTMHDVNCSSVVRPDGEGELFNPPSVANALQSSGFIVTFDGHPADKVVETSVHDTRIQSTEKLLRAFMRTTVVSESVLRQKFGNKSTAFFDGVLSELMGAGIVIEEHSRGGKRQGHYRLVSRFQDVWQGFQQCGGSFERFITLMKSH